MASRVQLQALLEGLLGSGNVYFQPPENFKMSYPCIIYSRNAGDTIYANDKPYSHQVGYQITVVDANPDSSIPGKVAEIPTSRFNRHYTVQNLNHDVYTIFY